MNELDQICNDIRKHLSSETFKAFELDPQNQVRDRLIEDVYHIYTTQLINYCRKLSIEETERRKIDNSFVKCNRCFGFHKKIDNIDNLCDKCEREVHIFNFDKKYKESL